MLGAESDGGGASEGTEAPEIAEQPAHVRQALKQQRQQSSGPGCTSAVELEQSEVHHASSDDAGGRKRAQQISRVSGKQHPGVSATAQGQGAFNGSSAKRSQDDDDIKFEHELERSHTAEAHLGRKQKRGKKRKPESQLQRVQAEVQAKKASSADAVLCIT